MGAKTTYDPELRTSEHGSRLYETWKRIKKYPYDFAFEEFQNFYAWAISAGYTRGAKLMRYDELVPYEPENCYWVSNFQEEWETEWCKKMG